MYKNICNKISNKHNYSVTVEKISGCIDEKSTSDRQRHIHEARIDSHT